MAVVWKFPAPLESDRFSCDMPQGARILTVQMQHDEPQMWALVTPGFAVERREFQWVGTGHTIAEGVAKDYVGTVQMQGGVLVFHLFEIRVRAV